MKEYIGVKIIKAEPAWKTTVLESGETVIIAKAERPDKTSLSTTEDGYKVVYPDGYVSWSPKDVFEEAYRETSGITFGLAIEAMKKGYKVARAGWNGKGMFLYLIKGTELQSGLKYGFGEYQDEPRFVNTICMKTAQNTLVVSWLASQTDMLADDWMIV